MADKKKLMKCFACPDKPATLDSNNSRQCLQCKKRYHSSCANRTVDKLRPGCFIACCGSKKNKSQPKRDSITSNTSDIEVEDETDKLDENSKVLLSILDKRFNKINNNISDALRHINDIQDRVADLENKFEVLEDKLQFNTENIISELHDRQSREKNIIIYNLDDSPNAASTDINVIQELFNKCSESLPFELNELLIQRLGNKFSRGKNRPLKITVPSVSNVHWIYSQKKFIVGNSKIAISGDLTKQQRDYRRSIIMELKSRISNGEKNILIKYVRGMPIIAPKDFNHQKNNSDNGDSS